MAAVVHIDEHNSTGPTVSHTISNSNYVSVDTSSQVAADYPITPTASVFQGSFQKWQLLHVQSLAGVTKVKNIKFFRNQGTPTSGDRHKTSATITSASYSSFTYTTPTTALLTGSTIHDVPATEPASANVGINSSFTGEITDLGSNSSSDYIRHQIQVSSATTSGATMTLRYQWDEVS